METSRAEDLEALRKTLSTFVRVTKREGGGGEQEIWARVEPVGHGLTERDGYVIELSIVRHRKGPAYFAMLTASRGQGEEPLAIMDMDFRLDWVADNAQVTQEVAAGVASRPAIIDNLIADAIYTELQLRMAAVDAANGSALVN